MSVLLDPGIQLAFQKPFTQLVKQNLRVTNPNSQPVAFKVKTTAPKQYCVRPNSGRIEPGENIDVQVLLQPMKEDPPLSVKCKDKFLVQSTFITPARESLSLNDLWAVVPGDDDTKVHQQKLKVTWLPAEGALPEEDEPEAGQSIFSHEGDSRFDTVRHYETVRQDPNGHENPAIPAFDEGPPSPPQVDALTYPELSTPPTEPQPLAPVAAPVAAAPQAPSSPTKDVAADYAGKLAEARAEIAKLQGLLVQANELRRRKPVDDGESAADHGRAVVEQNIAPEGVPLNVVAVLSFLVFLVTYLFF